MDGCSIISVLKNLFEIYEVCHATEYAREVFDWELSKIIYQDNWEYKFQDNLRDHF